MRLVRGRGEDAPVVVTCSGLSNRNVDGVWDEIVAHRERLGEERLERKRAEQQLEFTWALVRDELLDRLKRSPGVAAARDEVRSAVLSGEIHAPEAADRILAAYDTDA
jgi:LAO/AO transport system kinase